MSGKRIVIIGGGFAGLQVAKKLGGDPRLEITLLDRNNHYVFQPMLYQVATAALSPTEIACPIRNVLAGYRNVTVLQANVTQLDLEKRQVTAESLQLPYDYLIVATGAENNYFGHDDWQPNATGLKSVFDAVTVRDRLLTAFERAEREPDETRRKQLLTFVVIGGGYTGIELAGAVAELARYTLAREFRRIHPALARVILIEAGPRILPAMSESLAHYARKVLESLRIEVLTGASASAVTEAGVTVGDQHIPCSTVLWAAGIRASSLGKQLGVATDHQGRVPVNPDLSIAAHPEVFVAGDLAHCPARDNAPLPALAPVAMQQGRHIARMIKRDLKGKSRTKFHYWNKGELAAIGRNRAVGLIGGIQVRGLPAWLMWVFIHIYYLSDFRNRLIVMLQWAWT
ncbi:MAG TPA: NAD(P)/FAD-dependent oxidoreductase, partial [Gammaproteobacteria bacterium]